MSRMQEHAVILRDGELVLRPMTEGDWELALQINNDPDLGYFTEGDDWTPYTLEEVQRIYLCVRRLGLQPRQPSSLREGGVSHRRCP